MSRPAARLTTILGAAGRAGDWSAAAAVCSLGLQQMQCWHHMHRRQLQQQQLQQEQLELKTACPALQWQPDHVCEPLRLRGATLLCVVVLLCCCFRVRTTVLGSRNQLCLNEKVLKLPGQAANFTCRALVQHKQCRW